VRAQKIRVRPIKFSAPPKIAELAVFDGANS
jgi:hypothetical protein